MSSARNAWAQIFLDTGITPKEAAELQEAVATFCYGATAESFDEWVEATIHTLVRGLGRAVHITTIKMAFQLVCPQVGLWSTDHPQNDPAVGPWFRRALDRLVATNRIVSYPGEIYEPVSLLERLAHTQSD